MLAAGTCSTVREAVINVWANSVLDVLDSLFVGISLAVATLECRGTKRNGRRSQIRLRLEVSGVSRPNYGLAAAFCQLPNANIQGGTPSATRTHRTTGDMYPSRPFGYGHGLVLGDGTC